MSVANHQDPLVALDEDSTGGRSDPSIQRRSLHGSQQLAQMLQDHFSSVWRLTRRLGISSAMAEEVAQEAFLIAAQKLDQVEQGRERAFLFGVALRLTANLRRSSAFRREVSDGDACAVATSSDQFDVAQLVVQKQQREALDSILDEMPSTLREALVLHAIEECSLQEIAETLGIPAGTAASRVRRAREDFARRVQRFRARLTHGKEDT